MVGLGIGFEDLIECGMGDDFVFVHGAAHSFGDLWKIDVAINEGIDGDFVGGVQHGGKSVVDFISLSRKLESWEMFGIGFFESKIVEFGEIGLDVSVGSMFWIGECVLNGQVYVGCGKLGEHGVIDKLDHRMNNTL